MTQKNSKSSQNAPLTKEPSNVSISPPDISDASVVDAIGKDEKERRVERRGWLLEQYKTHVDLYKQYLDLTVKFDAFYYIATGAILSFYFTRTKDELATHPDIRLSLLFPIAMSLSFALVYIIGYLELKRKINVMGEIVRELGREKGKNALMMVPNFNILGVFLILAALFKFLIAIALGLYYAYGRL